MSKSCNHNNKSQDAITNSSETKHKCCEHNEHKCCGSHNHQPVEAKPNQAINSYYCPMKCEGDKVYPKFGSCPICGMDLVPEYSDSTSDDMIYKKLNQKMVLALIFTLPVLFISMSSMLSVNPLGFLGTRIINYIELILTIPVVFWLCGDYFVRAWRSIITFRLNMFTLIGLGTGTAFIFSLVGLFFPELFPEPLKDDFGNVHLYFESTVVILALVLCGQVLEAKVHMRSENAMEDLIRSIPSEVIRLNPNGEEVIKVEDIKVDDKLRIKPGEKIPVDGVILQGRATIDESAVTGESMPLDKTQGDWLYSGTLNGNTPITLQAKKIGRDSFVLQIADMLNQAASSKAPIQKLADKVVKFFVPTIMAISIITYLVWMLYTNSQSYALANAIAVMIIACPCALGLATPVSIKIGINRAALKGILIRNAEILERVKDINVLVVDKTGTITEGKPSIDKFVVFDKTQEPKILQYVVSLNNQSEHPLAKAIVKYGKNKIKNLIAVKDFKAEIGMGASGIIDGHNFTIGNLKIVEKLGATLEDDILNSTKSYQKQGKTISFIVLDDKTVRNKVVGYIVLSDKAKQTSKQAIAKLQAKGIEVIMLTGDDKATASYIAEQVGITQIQANATPADKQAKIKSLQAQGYIVAMTGDGINDAPALAQADIAIAMGSGTDLAIDNSDISLIKDDLLNINEAINLSQHILKNIKQNLLFAFFYNSLGIPIAAGVLYPAFGILLSPMVAAIAMSLSSLSVVLNSQRLKKV